MAKSPLFRFGGGDVDTSAGDRMVVRVTFNWLKPGTEKRIVLPVFTELLLIALGFLW